MNFRKMKGFISIVIVLSMLLSTVLTVSAADNYSRFVDFPTGWSKVAMEHAVDNGLLYGSSETTINPKDNLTRAEMATIINRVFGATIKADISKYTDVTPDDWYYDEIARAVNMRTFIGDSATTINPEESITREAVFTVVARALVLETEDYTSLEAFPDSELVSDWAKSAAAVLVAKGYIHGNDEGKLCPQCYITREEFAQMMYNIIKTYYTKSGKVNSTGKDSSLIRTSGVTLSNVTIDGDLIIGDGVGNGTVVLNNVTVNGRLLCRGGEKGIKLVNTKVKEYVVVYDVNGIVHFQNYRTEDVFKNIKEITPATFLKKVGGGGGGYSGGGETAEYHTVYFHDGANENHFATVAVNKAANDANRNILGAGKTLDGIYQGKLVTLPAYDRADLGYNLLNTAYTHQVDKEYLYETSPGVWSAFTNTTVVNGDIHVYYATKIAAMAMDVPQIGIPYTLDLRYDSESRLADSLKDALIETGLTLEKNVVKTKVDAKLASMYNLLNQKTGLVDADGNILDKDLSLKIIDVIDYDQIQAKVEERVNEMLNGETEELRAVLAFFDIPTLVDEIGGKKLIDLIGDDSLRSILKDNEFRNDGIVFVQDKIKTDSDLIVSVLNSSSKNTLIESAASKNKFIAKLVGNATLRDEVLETLTSNAIKTKLLTYLDKTNVKAEILKILKNDTDFKNSIIVIDNTDEKYKSSLALRKVLVKAVAEPGKVYNDNDPTHETMSESAKKVREAVYKVIEDNQTKFGNLSVGFSSKYGYEAIVYGYVNGIDSVKDKFQNISFRPAQWQNYIKLIDEVIAEVVEKYFSTDANDQLEEELQAVIDTTVVDFAKKYLNQIPIVDGDEESDKKIQDVIENSVIAFIEAYFDGKTDLNNDTDIAGLAEDIKAVFVEKVKSVDVAKIQQPIVTFVTDALNADFVDDFVLDNYDAIVDAVEDEFIMSYIDTLSDDEVDDLVKDHADIDMIIEHIGKLTPAKRAELAQQIIDILDQYAPYVEFMQAFETKADSFEVNKHNTHFVTAVGEAIDTFDFAEMLGILRNKGFGVMIDALGEDVMYEIFDSTTSKYWIELEKVVDEVEASSDANIKRYYTTSMNATINIPDILKGIYGRAAAKLKTKLENKGGYYYQNNLALQKFVNINWFDLAVAYDAARVDESTGATGYYFRDYMEYYCALLDVAIIFDDALCYYGDLSDEEYKAVKEGLTQDVADFLKEMQLISDKLENNQPIVGGFTLQSLINKIDSVKQTLASSGGSAVGSYMSTLEPVIDHVKTILVDLGEGDLPGGYTLDDLDTLSRKLVTVMEGMSEGEYDAINAKFEDIIASALSRIDAVLTEMDETGNLPFESILSKVSVLNKIYNQYATPIQKIISVLADLDLESINVPVDAEKFEEILFGREEDIFNIDNVIELVKGRLGASEATGYQNGKYFVDKYAKDFNGDSVNDITFSRYFY